MIRAIIFLSLFIGTNSSYLGTNCHLNKTQPNLVFDKCQRIQVTDLTSFCPIFDSNSCKTNPCFCDPMVLPTSFPCPERYVCNWSKKVDPSPSGQDLSENAKIYIGIGVPAFFLLGIGIIICVYRWKRQRNHPMLPENANSFENPTYSECPYPSCVYCDPEFVSETA